MSDTKLYAKNNRLKSSPATSCCLVTRKTANTSSLSLTHSDYFLHLAPLYKVRLDLLYAALCAAQQLSGEREVVADTGGDKNITKVMEALKLDFKVLKVRIVLHFGSARPGRLEVTTTIMRGSSMFIAPQVSSSIHTSIVISFCYLPFLSQLLASRIL